MSSLYKISEDLINIFNDIEANEGEITPELENQLIITKDNLNNKIEDYVRAIKEYQNDADFCKEEKSSINTKQNIYKNRVERLKFNLLNAVLAFGNNGKNNKYIETATYRLSTKNRVEEIVHEDRIAILIKYLKEYLEEITKEGILIDDIDNIDEQSIVDGINMIYRAEYGEDAKLFTKDDIEHIQIKLTFETNPIEMIKEYSNAIADFAEDKYGMSNIEYNKDKQDWKIILKTYPNNNVTIAELKEKQSLLIK